MLLFVIIIIFSDILNEECINYNDRYKCIYGQNHYNEEWDNYCFQTPPRNDLYGNYRETYQDMHYLVGYAQLIYSENKMQCTINFITFVNPKLGKKGIDYYILYKFGEIETFNNNYKVISSNSYPKGLSISAQIIDNITNNTIAKLELENEYFIWDNKRIESNKKYENGQKGVIVELFGWSYDDIGEECEFLQNAGYLGVKITPPNECILNYDVVEKDELNPWWFFLQRCLIN